ncbi:hypothetical protein GD1_210 [Paraglaciecola Antarctic GD virus 1]|nr:hypothetical protein GD1_210 [Paraglaciecola Antarctic GD virus 1]
MQDENDGLSTVIRQLEQSNKRTSIKQMKELKNRIHQLQESGLAIPQELTESYNRLAQDANKAMKDNVDKMQKHKETLVGHLKDGISDLANGVQGIFGDVLGQLTNNPLFTFAKGFAKSSIGLLGGLLPSMNQGEAEEFEVGSPEAEAEKTDERNDMLTKIEANTASLLAIWMDQSEAVAEEATNDLIDPPDDFVGPPRPENESSNGMFSGFLVNLASTLKRVLLTGSILAFLANPLTLGVIALTAGLALLYTKWDEWDIGTKLAGIPTLFADLFREYGLEFSLILVGVFKKIGDSLLTGIGSLFGNPEFFDGVGERVGAALFDGVQILMSIPDMISDAISGAFDSLNSSFEELITSIKGIFGFGDDDDSDEVKALIKANESKSIDQITDRLAEIEQLNSGFTGGLFNSNDDEKEALNSLLENRQADTNVMSKSIQAAGESRKNTAANVTMQTNTTTSVNNIQNNASPTMKMASSRSSGGAYTQKLGKMA